MKSKKFLKLTALFICIALLLPMVFACGEKPDAADKADDAADSTPEPTEPPTPAPTPEPTEPPPTEPPTEPFAPDSNMTYWDQIAAELAHHGLVDGLKFSPGADEAELMKKFSVGSGKKEELDVSGDNVPFSAAYRVTIPKDVPNFWEASYNCAFEKDLPVEVDDLIVGVIWVRGVRLSETEKFATDDPPQYYLAIKTATDNWATEGGVEPLREQILEPEWQKVFFYGNVVNEESNSKNLQFQIFLGYGNQQVDFGGIISYKFPWTAENQKAVQRLLG